MSSSDRGKSKKPQRRFQFIDNSNVGATGTNSTQVRRHVMQEYMREKRWETRARAEGEVLDSSAPTSLPSQSQTSPRRKPVQKSRAKSQTSPNLQDAQFFQSAGLSDQRPISSGYPVQESRRPSEPQTQFIDPSTQIQDDIIEEIPRKPTSPVRLYPNRPRRGFYLTPQSFALLADLSDVSPPTPTSTIISGSSLPSATPSLTQSPVYRTSPSPSPMSVLSAARTDPFGSLPIDLSEGDQELFDFYATVMPACSYGFERRSPRAHNWYLSVFIPEAMKSPVAFQNTILVHAANTQAWVRGLSETPSSIEHRARASSMLSEQFQKFPHDTSDAAISSTLSAAALEDFDPRPERRQFAWIHWQAAVQKIRDRGGPLALEQHKSLRMLINWSDYIFSGYSSHRPAFFFDHRLSPGYLTEIEATSVGQNELTRQCEEFIIFLKCAESLALVAANMQNNPTARKNQMMRYSVFREGRPLYNLLSSPNGPRYTKTGQLKQIISRLAALMTINVAVWEYRYSPSASEEFFTELLENISYNDLDIHISVEALIQVLLSGSENPRLVHTERPWLVGRLLKVAKRLSRSSWERLNEFLLQCLTLGPNLSPVIDAWEDGLRAEILSAPLTSFVLPLMQAT